MPITVTPISQASYEAQRFEMIKKVENNGFYNSNVHNDGVGIPTIGVGFNLRNKTILTEVFREVNGISPTTALTTTQLNQINQIHSETLKNFKLPSNSDIGTIARINQINNNNFVLSEIQALNVFNRIAPTFESEVNSRIGNIAYSNERLALYSLAWNNPALLGKGLKTAFDNGDRAKAWYEIRYNTNAGKSKSDGIAKRRYYESEFISPFLNNSSPTASELQNLRSLLYTKGNQINVYERQYQKMIDRAEQDYGILNIKTKDEILLPLKNTTYNDEINYIRNYLLQRYQNPSLFEPIQNGVQIAYNGSLGDLYYSSNFGDLIRNEFGADVNLNSKLLGEIRAADNSLLGQIMNGNTDLINNGGSTIKVKTFIEVLSDRVDSITDFFTDYVNEATKYYEEVLSVDQFQNALAQIAVRLANGEDFNVVINQTAAQLMLGTGVQVLFDKLVLGSNLIPSNYQNYTSQALANATIQGLLTGDYQQALQNASVQAAIQGGVVNNINFLTQPNYLAPIRDSSGFYILNSQGQIQYANQLNPAGIGVTAAVVSLVGSLLNGGINSASINNALKAGTIGYTSAAITTSLVGTAGVAGAGIASAGGTAGAFSMYGAYAGPVGIAVGFALGYLTEGLFAKTQYIHGETIGNITQTQADGSLLLIGTRPAGSLLRTTGTTNDDYIGNDSADNTGGADVIVGQSGMNEIYARGGHDFIEGRGAADYIEAGTGDDQVEAGDGNDFVDGGAGNDRIFGQAGNDSILGGAGNVIFLRNWQQFRLAT